MKFQREDGLKMEVGQYTKKVKLGNISEKV
jgi:hypothetical protein